MEALEALAATNIKVSEAKNSLIALKKDEDKYLTEREQKELARIQNILDESASLLTRIKTNYEGVHEILKYASELASFVGEAQQNFKQLLEEYEERDKAWQVKMTKIEKDMDDHKKKVAIDTSFIENERKNIAQAHKNIEDQWKKIADERGTLDRAIKRLKEKRI